jgi:hypothetical protein
MAYLSEAEVRQRAAQVTRRLHKSARQILAEAAPADAAFDVFLSHSSNEPSDILVGVKKLLEDHGLSVCVDKYSDPQLSADKITPETAEILRRRMRQSKSLLYVYSQHSTKSRWMPWELGFFDGLKGRVGIVPVTGDQEETFKGEEYLNLYPFVDEALIDHTEDQTLWINKGYKVYAQLAQWAKGGEKIQRHE